MKVCLRTMTSGLLIALMFASAVVPAASAATTEEQGTKRESITMSPASQDYQLKAGEVKRDTLTILNDGDIDYDFLLYARPYSVKNSAYEADFQTITPRTDLYKWVQFDKTSYHLEAGEHVEVDYTLRVPADASPGGHYGVLFAETQPTGTAEQTSVARKKRVGSIIYATVDGDIQLAGSAEGTTVPFWQSRPPLTATTSVKNTGNTDFLATVQFTVRDLFGGLKYSQKTEYVVLPDTTRAISLQWSDSPWFGLYKVDVDTSFLDKQQSSHSSFVLLAPRWLAVVLASALVVGAIYAFHRWRR